MMRHCQWHLVRRPTLWLKCEGEVILLLKLCLDAMDIVGRVNI